MPGVAKDAADRPGRAFKAMGAIRGDAGCRGSPGMPRIARGALLRPRGAVRGDAERREDNFRKDFQDEEGKKIKPRRQMEARNKSKLPVEARKRLDVGDIFSMPPAQLFTASRAITSETGQK